MTNTELFEKRENLLKEAKELIGTVEKRDGQKFTEEEETRYNRLLEEAKRIGRVLGESQRVSPVAPETTAAPKLPRAYRDSSGREFRIYDHDVDIRSGPQPELPDGIRRDELSLTRFIRAAATKDWSIAPAEHRVMTYERDEKRADPQSVADFTAGGYAVPSPMSKEIIQSARNNMAVMQAGARTVEMTSKTMDFAIVETEPTAYWTAENAALTQSEMEFGAVTLRAEKCGLWIPVSMELIMNASNMEEQIRDSMSYAVQKAWDYACLLGSGSASQPTGIYNISGVQSTDLAGSQIRTNHFCDAYGALMDYNAPDGVGAISEIHNSDIANVLDSLKDGEGNYILNKEGGAPASWGKMKHYISNQITTSSSQAHIFVGDFKQLYLGMRMGINVEVTQNTTDAFKKCQYWFRATFFGDCYVVKPTWFYIIKNAGT